MPSEEYFNRIEIVVDVTGCLFNFFNEFEDEALMTGHVKRLFRMYESEPDRGPISYGLPFCTGQYLSEGFAKANGCVYRIVEYLDDTALSCLCPEIELSGIEMSGTDYEPLLCLQGRERLGGDKTAVGSIGLIDALNGKADGLELMAKNGWASWTRISDADLEGGCRMLCELAIRWLAEERERCFREAICDKSSQIAKSIQRDADGFFYDAASFFERSSLACGVSMNDWAQTWQKNLRPKEFHMRHPQGIFLTDRVKIADRGTALWTAGTSSAPICPAFFVGGISGNVMPDKDSGRTKMALWYSSAKDGDKRVYASTKDLFSLAAGRTPEENPFDQMRSDGWGWAYRELYSGLEWSDADAARVAVQSAAEWSRTYLDEYLDRLRKMP